MPKQAPPKRGVGAPSKLDAITKKTLLDEIAAGATYSDAAVLAGIDFATFKRWRVKGEESPESEYGVFCSELDAARVKRRRWYRMTVAKLALEKKDYKGIAWIASVTEPEEFSPKVHIVVEQELTQAMDRLTKEFENDPDLLERALAAIAGTNGRRSLGGIEKAQSTAVYGPSAETDAASAIAAAIVLPGADV